MKKILAMIMVLCLLICVAACGNNSDGNTTDNSTTTGTAPLNPTVSVDLDDVMLMFLITDNGATDGSNPMVAKTTTDKAVMQSVIDIINAAEKTPCTRDITKDPATGAVIPSRTVVGVRFNVGSDSVNYFVTDTNGVYTIVIGGYRYELSAHTAEQVKTQIDAIYAGIESAEQSWS